MSRITIEVDDDLLEVASRALGTSSMVDTINGALEVVVSHSKRAEAFGNPLIWGGPDLADPEVRAAARHGAMRSSDELGG